MVVPACPYCSVGFPAQAYRELLVTTPGLGQYISGAILFEETLYQNTTTGSTMVDELNKQGIVPGVQPPPAQAPTRTSHTCAHVRDIVTGLMCLLGKALLP